MVRTSADLSDKEREAAELVARGCNYSEAARQVGVDPSTVWRWGQKPAFKMEVDLILQDIRAATVRRAIRLKEKAYRVFDELMDADEKPIKLGAAKEAARVTEADAGRNRNPSPAWDMADIADPGRGED